VVTNRRKTRHRDRIVASYCLGTRRLYDFVDDNPLLAFLPIDQVCNPQEVAGNARMVSITQAFAVDMTGQVCVDQFEGEFYGGVSTQAGFIRGAARSPGGKPIICLASTTEDGTSRIKPFLETGDGVGIARSDVHYVVTEYGIAYLFGKSIRERALALIDVAHPNCREELLAAAKRLGYVLPEQYLASQAAYPVHEERTVQLKNGATVLIRPPAPQTRARCRRSFTVSRQTKSTRGSSGGRVRSPMRSCRRCAMSTTRPRSPSWP
jgi:acyl-CoA hydrolase